MRFAFLVSIALGFFSQVQSHSTGVDTCEIAPNHGSWAQGCNPNNCFPVGGGAIGGQLPYVIEVMQGTNIINNYAPSTQYNVVLRSTNTSTGVCTTSSCFQGFVINVGNGRINGNFQTVSANANITSGSLNLDPTDMNVRRMSSCNNGLTHTSNSFKRNVRMTWISPPFGSGPVTFKSIIVTSRTTFNYVARLILNEQVAVTPSPSPISRSININTYTTTDCSGAPSFTNVVFPQNVCIQQFNLMGGAIFSCDINTVHASMYTDSQCTNLSQNISFGSGSCNTQGVSSGSIILNCPAASSSPTVSPNATGTPTNSRTMRASRTPSITASNTHSNTASITIGVQPSLSSSISYSSSSTPSASASNSQTSSNSGSVRPTPSNTDTPLETDTNTPSLTPNILPTTTSTRSNLPSYSSSPSVTPTSSASHTNSHTASYTMEPSISIGSTPSRTPLPSRSEIVSETSTPSYSPTLGSSPSATETNNPDFITIITTTEQSQEQRLSNIGSGAAIGIIATVVLVGLFYVIHKRNMKNRSSSRNVIIMRESITESHNPSFGLENVEPYMAKKPSFRVNNMETGRAKFDPVSINA